MSANTFYITTAIAYTSGKPHIGNCYDPIAADVIARFKRKQGFDVRFQTGTDEHGQKIELAAKKEGISPREFVDNVAATIKKLWDDVGTAYDYFIRTTDPYHEKQVQKIFKKLYDQGDIYKGTYEGLYCRPCESFWTSSQLTDGKCPDCGREVITANEEAYFFKMGKYADRLIEYMNSSDFICPESRKNEMINNFLKPGLQDLCVSRTSFTWGIPVSFDEKHVVYVWLDALVNYITGLGYDADGNHGELFNKYWPADLHVIGKDIVRFHTIYWPIFLMALGLDLPKKVFGHAWLLTGEVKMSKSRGNVIYADDVAAIFGTDALRFYMLSEMPYEQDGNFTWELFAAKYNAELANSLGNLVSRVIAMIKKYFDGTINNKGACAKRGQDADTQTPLSPDDGEAVRACFAGYIDSKPAVVAAKMESLHIADAMDEVFDLFKRCNKYIDETMPWVLAKDPEKADMLEAVLFDLSVAILIGASLLEPFMPQTALAISCDFNAALPTFGQMCQSAKPDDGQTSCRHDCQIMQTGGLYEKISVSSNSAMLFERIDIKKLEQRLEQFYDKTRRPS